MRKQSFDRVRKTLCILLAVLLLVSLTAASASAWYNKKGEVIAPPEKAKEAKLPAPVESAPAPVESVPAPEIAPAPSALGCAGGFGGCGGFGECGGFGGCGGFGNCDRFGCCGRCGDEKKIAVITAVRASVAEGEGCFDRVLW